MVSNFFLLAAAAIALAAPTVQAQSDSTSAAHIGVIYPLSTNGKSAGSISNHFSLHLLSGYSKSETGLALSGLANIIRENTTGAAIAGLVNQVGENAHGVQIAGIGNYVKDTASGVMIGGIYNVAANSRIQLGGIANFVKNDISGIQISGFSNSARNVHTQIGGFVNVARNVKGIQLAGFLNIADSSDYSIGVINLVKNGEKGLGAYLDENMTTTITFRSGGRKMYSIVGAGYNRRPGGDEYLAMEAGIGANWKLGRNFRLKGEAVSKSLTQNFDDDRHTVSLRALPSLVIARRLEISAGPSINYTHYEIDGDLFPLPGKYLVTNRGHDHFHGLSIGWTAGLQILF